MRHRFLPLVIFLLVDLHWFPAGRESTLSPIAGATVAFGMQSPARGANDSKLPNGVLLGTHWASANAEFGKAEPSDRTWWIAEVNGEVQVHEIPNILFPRKEGFWVAGTKEIQKGQYFERYVWTAPLGETPKSNVPDLSNAVCHDEKVVRDILFIGINYIALKQFGSVLCARYDESTQFYVSTLDKPNWFNASKELGLEISEVLGTSGLDRFNKACVAKGEAKSDDLDCGRLHARPTSWAILREKGRWILRGNGYYGDRVCDGYFGTEFDVNMRPPKSVVGYDELSIGWDGVQKAFSDAKDAFESPNGDFLIVIRKNELNICRLTKGRIGAVISRHPLHENEYAVMAQWSLGDNVARWGGQVSRLQNLGAK